jgi:hypothetical protein
VEVNAVRVLVVYENSDEERIAHALANQVPDLCHEVLNKAVSELNIHRPPITSRAMSYRELFSGCTEYERNAYVQALERAVFVE